MAAAAILKIVKWPYLSRGLSDFDEIWHGDAVQRTIQYGLVNSVMGQISCSTERICSYFSEASDVV